MKMNYSIKQLTPFLRERTHVGFI